MGLDMYLQASVYIGANYKHNEVSGIVDIHKQNQPIDLPLNKIVSVVLDLGYWRKANAIHKYFVDVVGDCDDDCRPIDVYGEHLENLKDLCEKVLADHSLAETLLPTASGFFFGGTDYDDYYFQYLRDTIKIIDDALKTNNNHFIYQASW